MAAAAAPAHAIRIRPRTKLEVGSRVRASARGRPPDGSRAGQGAARDRRARDRACKGRGRAGVRRRALGRRPGFANTIARELGVRGTLIVVAGPAYWAITSYPDPMRAADALRSAVNARENDRLVDELVPAIRRIGRIDPGPAAIDVRRSPTGAGRPERRRLPRRPRRRVQARRADRRGRDRAAVHPGGVLLAARARRRRAREREVHEAGEQSADDELVELGDEIRELDLDTAMPGASRAGAHRVRAGDRALRPGERAALGRPERVPGRTGAGRDRRRQAPSCGGARATRVEQHRWPKATSSGSPHPSGSSDARLTHYMRWLDRGFETTTSSGAGRSRTSSSSGARCGSTSRCRAATTACWPAARCRGPSGSRARS